MNVYLFRWSCSHRFSSSEKWTKQFLVPPPLLPLLTLCPRFGAIYRFIRYGIYHVVNMFFRLRFVFLSSISSLCKRVFVVDRQHQCHFISTILYKFFWCHFSFSRKRHYEARNESRIIIIIETIKCRWGCWCCCCCWLWMSRTIFCDSLFPSRQERAIFFSKLKEHQI